MNGFILILNSKAKLQIHTLTVMLVNNNKRCSLSYKVIYFIAIIFLKKRLLHFIYGTGEVCFYVSIFYNLWLITNGRGFILVYILMGLINILLVNDSFLLNNKFICAKKANYLIGLIFM